ncbi:PEBP-like protein [Agrocybe pediades]|nr:PEBP-like protein [Agrocybe pediades]
MPNLSNVTTAFSSAEIVPDVLPSFTPEDTIDVAFPSVTVVPGVLLTTDQTAMFPTLTLTAANTSNSSDANTTAWVVALVDPDAPTPQNRSISQFLHFLGGDFTVDGSGLLSNTSPALMEFTPPAPPPGSDPHRYVLLVFDQPDNFDTDGPTFVNSTTPRTNFNISVFAQEVALGAPIAGNYFLVGPMNSSSSSVMAGGPTTSPSSPPLSGTPAATSPDTLTNSPTDTSAPSSPSPGAGMMNKSNIFSLQGFVLGVVMTILLL